MKQTNADPRQVRLTKINRLPRLPKVPTSKAGRFKFSQDLLVAKEPARTKASPVAPFSCKFSGGKRNQHSTYYSAFQTHHLHTNSKMTTSYMPQRCRTSVPATTFRGFFWQSQGTGSGGSTNVGRTGYQQLGSFELQQATNQQNQQQVNQVEQNTEINPDWLKNFTVRSHFKTWLHYWLLETHVQSWVKNFKLFGATLVTDLGLFIHLLLEVSWIQNS